MFNLINLLITEKDKYNIAKEIKNRFKKDLLNSVYSEVAIMYDPYKHQLFITSTGNIDKLQYDGFMWFKDISTDKIEKITIKNILEKI